MKITVDLQSCQTDSRDRGIGRYAMSLTEAIARRLDPATKLTIAVDAVDECRLRDVRNTLRHRGIEAEVAAASYPATEFSDLSASISAAAGLLRSQFFASLDTDILLATSFFEVGSCYSTALDHAALQGTRTAVIAYDIIPLIFPEKYLPEGEFISDWYPKKVEEFKRFDLFLAISEATRHDLIEKLQIDPEKIRLIGAGLDVGMQGGSANDGELLAALGVRDPFVLMVGNADWRKNCMGALEAFADLPSDLRNRHQLVFTQVGDDVRNALKGKYAHLRDRVVIAGKVCEATLAELYAKCKAFFFPSLYEGFGLPVLEAMAHGAPVLSSNRGALAEVVHDKRMLFDPATPNAGSDLLRRTLEDESFRLQLLDGAREHALTFTWDRCAQLALEALTQDVHEHPRERAKTWRPDDADIATMAEACIDAGPRSAALLRNGLQAISDAGKRRILLDISEVVRLDARSGIQRVVRNYLYGLMALAASGECEAEPICWTESGVRYARSYARDRLKVDCAGKDDEVDVRANDFLFMLDSSWWGMDRFDALKRQVWNAGGEVAWMVYDLVPITIPQHCDPVMPPVFREWLEHVAPLSDGFVCISEATRDDLESFIDRALPAGARRPWTWSLHLGSDLESGQAAEPTDKAISACQRMAGHPWLLALGTVEPRKDYATILAAYERLWEKGQDVGLIVIGRQGWNIESFAAKLRSHPEFGKRLFWMEGVPDGDIQYVLAHASGLVQASIAEGFGLPVVEAGSLGVPLILSDIPVFREIAGDEASYFPVGDAAALASTIEGAMLSGWKHPKHIRTMTWRESSERLMAFLLQNSR